MKNRITLALLVVTLAVLCTARAASVRGTAHGPSTPDVAPPPAACDVEAYVVDPDPKGLNVRDAPGVAGKVVAVIPLDGDGTTVHLVASSPNGWVQLDRAETIGGAVVFDGKGWVSGNMLGTSTRGYGTRGVKLRGDGKAAKVVGIIPPEAEVRVAGCAADRVKVKYKNLTGWLDPVDQCPNPVTLCN
ncbi:MAG TPA: SH3 domain-containing protein [Pyrinomonadaceae bacterium]|jgi:SH3-like domain-containing protein